MLPSPGAIPPRNKFIFFKILMSDIFGEYQPISTKFSEISLISGEQQFGEKKV